MENLKQFTKRLIKEEDAQGMTEYILLLVAVVGIVMVFKTQITNKVTAAVQTLGDKIGTALQ